MPPIKKTSSSKEVERGSVSPSDLVRGLMPLPGGAVLNRILDLDRPEEFVRRISPVDFYWLVKKIGGEDALPILKLASNEQWQFVLDLELWERDRLDVEQAGLWLGRLFQADSERIAEWLLSEAELLTYYYLSHVIEVQVRQKDEPFDDPSFLTFDDVYYFRVRNAEHEEFVQGLLRHLVEMDYLRYQALMAGLAGTLRDEVEEEMYRQRNVRIAEQGFLPYDEAVALYAHVSPHALKSEKISPSPSGLGPDSPPAPLVPILQAGDESLMLKAVRRSGDPLLMDRLRLEFAGLCNQVMSADRVRVSDTEDLVKACRKVAGYINVGLERLSMQDLSAAEDYLRKNPLHQIFRVGFSSALEVRWEAERWVKKAWFIRQGLRPGFWDDWGGTLVGILQKRPLFYRGAQSQQPYAEFEGTAEVEECREILRHMMVLDKLLENLSSGYHVDRQWSKDPLFTFHALLMNFWARQKLKITPGFEPLSLEEVRNFFKAVRSGDEKPPFSMRGYKEVFVEDMTAGLKDFDQEAEKALRDTLSMVWERFAEEYAWVASADLDGRYLKFILTSPSPGAAPG
jgi:Family of unknown function (DUF6178)